MKRNDSAEIGLVLIICVVFFSSAYCSEPQGIPMLTEGPIIGNANFSDKPSACTVVSSQYDDPPSRASTTTYTSSMISLTSSAQFGTAGTTTTI